MKKSIQWQLIISLSVVLLIATSLAIGGIYAVAHQEANKVFDYYLQQAVMFTPFHLDEEAEYSRKDLLSEDIFMQVWNPDGDLIYYSNADFIMPRYKTIGFQNIEAFGSHWRIYSTSRRGHDIQVAQPDSKRDLLASNLAQRSLLPFLVLIPLMLLLTGWIVKRNFKPVTQLTLAIEKRSPTDLAPISAQGQPRELVPIISALNNLLGQLDHTLQLQHHFIADASHELRSPLAALKIQIQLAERAKTDLQRLQAIQKLRNRIDRAIYLVEQLLTLARHDVPTIEKEWVQLNPLIKALVHEYQVLAHNKGLTLITISPAQNITVLVNESGLEILIKNLLDNALKYTPTGGEVKIGLENSPLHINLWVEDNGIGIPEAEKSQVFERFYRASNHQESGSGLGLAIVHNIVKQLDLTIALSTPPSGQGLRVTVQFPQLLPVLG